MAITISAEKYAKTINEIVLQGMITRDLVFDPANWAGAKTFHAPSLSISGFTDADAHDVAGTWDDSSNMTDNVYTLEQYRQKRTRIDKTLIVDNNYLPAVGNIESTFLKTQAIPEFDARNFSKIAASALAATASTHYGTVLATETVGTDITKDNVLSKLDAALTASRIATYQSEGRPVICYVSMAMWRLLRIANEIQHRMDVIVSDGKDGRSVGTQIGMLNGVRIIPVLDDVRRFQTVFNWNVAGGGFAPGTSAQAINYMVVVPGKIAFVKKFDDIYLSAPGENDNGNKYGFEQFAYFDTFIFPNGYDNLIDSIFVSVAPAA